MITQLMTLLFGGGRNLVKDTAEVFTTNAEAQAVRDAVMSQAALDQFSKEFQLLERSRFDRFMDALNRIPRPAMALGTLGLFAAAMVDPIWFAERMQGVALVPEPLWWLLGAIVGFYFGARHQTKGQDFQRSMAATLARAQQVTDNLEALSVLKQGEAVDDNPALAEMIRR
ncbi:MAG: carboxylesterase [Rhodobacteraceae bacterium]|nr:carboxylesterase [Paracoccaceae bacterium]